VPVPSYSDHFVSFKTNECIRQGDSSKIKKKIKFTNTDWSQFFERYLEVKKSTCYADKTEGQQLCMLRVST
jgi:hypothetical protein